MTAVAGGASAQIQIPPSLQGFPTGATRASAPSVEGLALEGAVDADEYVVGPGDVFTVTIGGRTPRQLTATVSADGVLAIPEAGSFQADGRSLRDVLAQARPALRRQFQNTVSNVTLAEPRSFYVHVSGAVPDPGRHVVRAVARVSDALEAASMEEPVSSLLPYAAGEDASGTTDLRPAYRGVRVEHRDGTARSVDLARYFATGDTRYNPYLRDGDRVVLPAFAPLREGAFVSGAVLRPGVYDLRAGDTVLDLAAVAGATDAASFRLVRAGAPVRELSRAEAGRTDVQPRDQVSAVDADPLAGAAAASGGVLFPGLYPIRSGETRVSDLVDLAGGLAPEALARAAYLERTGAALDSAEVDALRSDGLGLLSQLYYRQESARTPRIGLDLGSPEALATVLRDGDRLVVPRGGDGVRVFGAVARPGFVPFQEGLRVEDYVEAAGGAAEGANSVLLVEAGTGRLAPEAGQTVRLGDAVFVAQEAEVATAEFAQVALQQRSIDREQERLERELRREAREAERDRRDARFRLVQTTITAVSTAASIIFTVIALSRN